MEKSTDKPQLQFVDKFVSLVELTLGTKLDSSGTYQLGVCKYKDDRTLEYRVRMLYEWQSPSNRPYTSGEILFSHPDTIYNLFIYIYAYPHLKPSFISLFPEQFIIASFDDEVLSNFALEPLLLAQTLVRILHKFLEKNFLFYSLMRLMRSS